MKLINPNGLDSLPPLVQPPALLISIEPPSDASINLRWHVTTPTPLVARSKRAMRLFQLHSSRDTHTSPQLTPQSLLTYHIAPQEQRRIDPRIPRTMRAAGLLLLLLAAAGVGGFILPTPATTPRRPLTTTTTTTGKPRAPINHSKVGRRDRSAISHTHPDVTPTRPQRGPPPAARGRV